MFNNLFCSIAAAGRTTHKKHPTYKQYIQYIQYICPYDTTWTRVWVNNSTCLLYLKCVYNSEETLVENALRHHGNQSSGCGDSRLHEAAAQSECNKREGRSFDKIFPVLRETQGDGKICSYRCWDVMTIPLLRRKWWRRRSISFADSIVGTCQHRLCRFKILCLVLDTDYYKWTENRTDSLAH